MKKLYFLTIALFFLVMGSCIAQYNVLLTFKGNASPQGKNPWGSPTISGKKLYGMTSQGAANNMGCVFSMDTTCSNYRDLLDFNGTNGSEPQFGTLVFYKGVLYGMTYAGGLNSGGIIFAIDSDGTHYRDLYDFSASGPNPTASLILVRNKLYGMTPYGGTNNSGNIFSIDTTGAAYRDLFDFSGANGEYPYGTLTLLHNKLYGGATMGGAHGDGNIFSIDTDGTGFRDLFDFSGANGQYPCWGGALTLVRGLFYGMACNGGAHSDGCIFSIDTTGNGYRDLMDYTGSSGPDYGANPSGALTLIGGNLFGMAPVGGANNGGCIYYLDTNGTGYTDLYDCSNSGAKPYGTLIQAGNLLYGTAQDTDVSGFGDGVVFKFRSSLVHNPTAIDNITALPNGTILYPNPNKGFFQLEINNYELGIKSTVEIYNLLGEKIYSTKLNAANTQIDLSNSAAGIYLYRVLTETSDLVSEGKFIIQK